MKSFELRALGFETVEVKSSVLKNQFENVIKNRKKVSQPEAYNLEASLSYFQ